MLRDAIRMALSPLAATAKLVRNRLHPAVLILLYHRVARLSYDPQELAVTPQNFRAQLRYLKENFTMCRLEDSWVELRKPAVVITFDDGYGDNAREALPILEELEVPATFFVSTETVGTDHEFWWDEVERLLYAERDYHASIELVFDGATRRWPTRELGERHGFYRDVLPLLRRTSPEKRNETIETIRAWCGAGATGRPTHRALSLEELRRLGASSVASVGAHTVTHSSLSALTAACQSEEILASKRWLEEFLGREVNSFSYPFGTRGDYTGETVAICREAGFARCCSNFPGLWRADTDAHQLPRRIVRNWELPVFKRELSRFWIS